MVKKQTITFLLVLATFNLFSSDMQTNKKEGQSFGKQKLSTVWKSGKLISKEELLPKEQKKKTFDSSYAKKEIERQTTQSEVSDFILSSEVQRNQKDNKGFTENELFLVRSQEILENDGKRIEEDKVDESEYTRHTCRQSGEPFVITLTRTLQVNVAYQEAVKQKNKICLGHHKQETYYWKSDAKKAAEKYRKKLSSDPTIKSYSVDYDGGAFEDYVLIVKWTHHKNTEDCHHYKHKEKVIQEESWQENGETWIYDNPALIPTTQSPDCTLIQQLCLDFQPTKNINGKEVSRKCWKEKLSFLYQFPPIKECQFLKGQNCILIERKCLQQTDFGCALWENTFKCLSKIKFKTLSSDQNDVIYGLSANEWDSSYPPNSSFADVATKLSIFENIKKELEKANAFDASKVSLFKGTKQKCTKNVASDLMYDCCFSYSGLAKQAGLAKCDADELALAEMREKGLCHYIGSYEEKMLDLWKSRDVHVFCCFPSKLARIIQEKGREQLNKGWGSAENPRCEGFKIEEISRLNFSKMDLSELFDQLSNQLPDGFDQKMESFQNRIQNDLKRAS